MLEFDSENPFPLVGAEACSYREAQRHAALVDAWLGINTERVEQQIVEAGLASAADQQLWIDLPTERLLTPYTELREMLERLRPAAGSLVVDLGAAYGRLGFVIAKHFPKVRFLGYEYIDARVREGRQALERAGAGELLCEDLSRESFRPIAADIYLIYDYGSRKAIEKTLLDLQAIARERSITVIGRGRASRDAIERRHPWLSQVVAPEHFAHYSFYRSGERA